MAKDQFDIYFAGEILPDHPIDAVKQWLGQQFKLQGDSLERLFSGTPVRIKQNVDMETAGRYRAAFRKAGALVKIRAVEAQAAATVQDSEPTAADDEPELLPPNTGSLEDCVVQAEPAPLPDISHMDLDSTDQPIDDQPSPPPADIDTDHLSAGPVNSGDLSDCVQEKPAQPIPDISAITLDEP